MQELNSSRQKVSLEMKTIGASVTYCFRFLFFFFNDGLSHVEFVAIQQRELQLELGSKNGVLNAMRLELTVSLTHLKAVKLQVRKA